MPNSLRARINKLAYQGKLSKEDAERIRDALEKQIPKPVKISGKYMKDFRIEPCDQVFCPSCGKRIRVKYKGKFCDKCGQAILWEEWSDDNDD